MPARAKSLQMQYPSSEAPRGQHLAQVLASWAFGRLEVSVSLVIGPRLATEESLTEELLEDASETGLLGKTGKGWTLARARS